MEGQLLDGEDASWHEQTVAQGSTQNDLARVPALSNPDRVDPSDPVDLPRQPVRGTAVNPRSWPAPGRRTARARADLRREASAGQQLTVRRFQRGRQAGRARLEACQAPAAGPRA